MREPAHVDPCIVRLAADPVAGDGVKQAEQVRDRQQIRDFEERGRMSFHFSESALTT